MIDVLVQYTKLPLHSPNSNNFPPDFFLRYLRVKTSQSRPNRKDTAEYGWVECQKVQNESWLLGWNLERWPTTEIMISAPIVFLDRCFLKIGSSFELLAWQSIQKRLRVEGWMARPKPRALENEANDLDRWADRIVAFNFILRLTRDFIVAFIAWSKPVYRSSGFQSLWHHTKWSR